MLRASDLGSGAKVTAQRYYKDTDFPSVISYERELKSGRVGATSLPYVDSEAEIGTSPQSTASFFNTVKRVFSTKQGQAELKKELTKELRGDLGLISNPQIGHPYRLGVGDDSFDLLMTVSVLGLRIEAHFALLRVDQVLGVLVVVGEPGQRVPRSVVARLAGITVGRIRAAQGPQNTALPIISGTPQVGQTLAATPGTWTASPTGFTYQWRRCDSAGASCADIAGATGTTYAIAGADVGSTIGVAVTASNAVGSATALAAPTGAVAGPPFNTAPPTISGTPAVGQTLTVATGPWVGGPTGFTYQWQRCDSAGANCSPVPGATSPTYSVTSADVGSTLRAAVTGTNAQGATTAVSAATPVIS